MRNSLDGLTAVRFFAALWVFVFHFHLRIPFAAPYPVVRVIENGALAMPVFFMLSGLVLGYRYRDQYESFSLFFRARVARIYPAYVLGLLVCLPILQWTQGFDAATGLFLLPVDLLLLQAWYPNLWGFWHHVGTWSISVEFFLYASFPLLLNFKKLSTRTLATFCIACVLLAGSWIPSLNVSASTELPFAIFYAIPIYSLPTFAIGVALAEFYRRGVNAHGAAPVALLVVLAFAGQFNARYAGLNLVTLPLVAATLLFAAHYKGGPGVARLFINRYTVYLGDISYAFFVYQIPLVLTLEHYVGRVRTIPMWWVFGSMLALNLLLAVLSHHWLEPWGSRWVMRHWKVAKPFAIA